MDDGIPKSVGRYTVDRLLGSGAMGFVYLGRDPDLDRAVAIKTVRNLNMEADALSLFLERFRNEARAAARLQHPNIVQVYDVGESEEVGPYLVFEYVAGSTLKQNLKKTGALSPARVVRLAEEIGDALEVAHAAGVIHRDIKPDNLLITPEGHAKLADFGVARIPDAQLTREGQFLGTPCYAAPETLGEGKYGVHSDLFSFAAVLYEAASGARAFPGDDALSVAHKVLHDEPASPRSVADDAGMIPDAVEALLLAGLSKDPTLRMASAADLAAALREAYEASGLVSNEDLGRPPSRRLALPASEAPRGSRGFAFSAVLLGLLAVGVAMVFAFDAAEDPIVVLGDDASVSTDAGNTRAPIGMRDAGVDATPDAPADAGRPDVGAPDAGESAAPELTPHEREEAAKNALSRARFLIRDGDLDGARTAIDEARRFDPGNPDIESLTEELDAAP